MVLSQLSRGKHEPLCHGNGASANVNVTGGVAPYTYTWLPAGGTAARGSFATGGIYTVTVTDVNGCHDTASVSIIEPTLLVSNIIKQTLPVVKAMVRQ
jgi:hypothetical protein